MLGDQWGGGEASDGVAELLFRSRALAAEERSAEIRGGHLVRAVREALGGPGSSSLRDALETVGISYDAAPPPAPPAAEDGRCHGARPAGQDPLPDPLPDRLPDPPVPGADVRALLASLGTWAGLTGDTRATSLHLFAALVEDCPEAVEFRESGLTADVVLRAGARYRYRVPGADEDTAFAPVRATADLLTVERPPDTDELRRRTPRFLPPKLTRHNNHLMPKFPERHNAPRGVRRIRRLMWLLSLDELVCWGTIVALVVRGLGPGPWWLLLCTVLVQCRAHMVFLPVWLIMKVTAVVLVPTPLSYAVCCAALTDLLHTYGWLRLKRVDLADPGLRFGWFARQTWDAWAKRALAETGTNR